MKIYTSYFYNVRFFKPNQLPISTAVWDPKWFHDNQGQEYDFIDKRGVLNGLRFSLFAPGPSCQDACHGREGCNSSPDTCVFLRLYKAQLSHINFDLVMATFEHIAVTAKDILDCTEDMEIMLIVHEAPDNPCSERSAIQQYFAEHGVEVTEWQRS